jgi:hypothetical protein
MRIRPSSNATIGCGCRHDAYPAVFAGFIPALEPVFRYVNTCTSEQMNRIRNMPFFIFFCLLCVLQVFYIAKSGKSAGFSTNILSRAFMPDTATQQSLPAPVIEARNFMKDNSIQEFSLSDSLAQDPLFVQRIMEYAYPGRFNSKSPVMLDDLKNRNPGSCKLLNQPILISIYDCTSERH